MVIFSLQLWVLYWFIFNPSIFGFIKKGDITSVLCTKYQPSEPAYTFPTMDRTKPWHLWPQVHIQPLLHSRGGVPSGFSNLTLEGTLELQISRTLSTKWILAVQVWPVTTRLCFEIEVYDLKEVSLLFGFGTISAKVCSELGDATLQSLALSGHLGWAILKHLLQIILFLLQLSNPALPSWLVCCLAKSNITSSSAKFFQNWWKRDQEISCSRGSLQHRQVYQIQHMLFLLDTQCSFVELA